MRQEKELMVATPTIGTPSCLRANGCTSRSSQRWSAATMSQVSVGGGEKDIGGLLPTLTSCSGAGAPHSPSRIGASGTTTTSRPLSSSPQRARASSISWTDQEGASAAGASPALLCGAILGQALCGLAAGGFAASPVGAGSLPTSPGADCCANATGPVASAHKAATTPQRALSIRKAPPLSNCRSPM